MSEIEIRIRSTLDGSGIDKAIQAIDRLRAKIEEVNKTLRPKGKSSGLDAVASDAEQAAKKIDQASAGVQQASKSLADNAEKTTKKVAQAGSGFQKASKAISADAKRIIEAFTGVSRSFAPFDQGFHRRAEALNRFAQQVRSLDRAADLLQQTQQDLNRMLHGGATSTEEVTAAQQRLVDVVNTSRQALRSMQASLEGAERTQRRYSEGYAQIVGAISELEAKLAKMKPTQEGYNEALEQWIELNRIREDAERAVAASSRDLAEMQERFVQAERQAQSLIASGIAARARLRDVTRDLTRFERERAQAQERYARYASLPDAERQAELAALREAIIQRYQFRDQERVRQAQMANRQYWIDLENEMQRRNRQLRAAIEARYAQSVVPTTTFDRVAEAQTRLTGASVLANRAIQGVIRSFQSAAQTAHAFSQALRATLQAVYQLADALLGGLSRGARIAANALGTLSQSAGMRFATLRRALDAAGRSSLLFGEQVRRGMAMADAAIARTTAGWSLLITGYSMRAFGTNLLRGRFFNLDDYFAYERAATRATIAVGVPGVATQEQFDLVQQLVFGIQRGQIQGERVGLPIYNLSAEDIALGAYYYGSAIGLPLTRENLVDVARSLSPMLQLAAFSGASPEQTIKGVLNAVMEFGIDPRDTDQYGRLINAPLVEKTAQLYGFLANVSTMEVQDITEFFKMVGPLARKAVGGDAMAALREVMGFSFMASEYGLRGSAPGRGLAQLLQSIYDPTGPMQEAARKYWGADNIQDVFLNPDGTLKGGIAGLFRPFLELSDREWIQAQAEIFTNNASRALIPLILQAREDPEKWERILADLQAEDVGDLLERATLVNMESLSGSIQNALNMWNQFVAAILRSSRGPLKGALDTVANIFAELSDIINTHPIVGRFVTGLVTLTGVIMTVVGSLLSLVAMVLILQRAFIFTHGSASLLFGLLASIPHVLAIGIPLFLALAAAAVALKTAWDENVLGIQDFVGALRGDFSRTFQETILPQLAETIRFVARTGKAFQELINGILLGVGPTNNLGAWLQAVFGPLMGPGIYGQLLRVQRALEPMRRSIVSFFQSARSGIPTIREVHRAFLMFFEEVFFQGSLDRHRLAMRRIGDWLGIEGLDRHVERVASRVRSGLGTAIAAVTAFVAALRQPIAQIRANLDAMASTASLRAFLDFLGAVGRGVAAGVAGSLLGIANGIAAITSALARMGDAGRWIADQIAQWTRYRFTLEGVGQVVGAVIGALLVNRLVAAVLPTRALMVATLQLATVVAQLAVQATLTAARIALLGVAATASAMQFLFAQSLALGLAGVLALVAAGIVVYIAKTKDLESAVSAARSVIDGFLAVMSRVFDILYVVASIVLAVGQAFLEAAKGVIGFKNEFEALGALIAVLVARWLLGGLIGALASVVTAFAAAGLGINKFTLALGGIGVAIIALSPYFDTLFGWFSKLNDMSGGWLDDAAIGTALIGPKNIGKLGKYVVALAARHPALALPLLLGAGVYILDKKVSEADFDPTSKQDLAAVWSQQYANVIAFKDYKQMAIDLGIVDAQRANAWIQGRMESDIQEGYLDFIRRFGTTPPNAIEAFGANQDIAREAIGNISPQAIVAAYTAHQTTAAAKQAEEAVRKAQEEVEDAKKQSESLVDKYWNDFRSLLDSLGIGKPIEDLFDLIGIDPEKGDFNPEKFFANTAYAKFDPFLENFLGPEFTKYLSDLEKYQQYEELVQRYGRAWVNERYRRMGEPIPTMPDMPTTEQLLDWVTEAEEKEAEAERYLAERERYLEELKNFNQQLAQGFQQIDLVGAMRMQFDQGTRGFVSALTGDLLPGFMSLPTAMAKYAEQIAQNIPEGADWSNIYEGIMDVVGHRMIAEDESIVPTTFWNVYGKNLHTMLRNSPGFQNWAAEMGATVDDLLKNVPKFVHAEELVPLAFSELADAMSTVPTEIYQRLDHLGTDLGRVGIEWLEVAQYAISKASAGERWNLADYIAEAWDMEIAEAEAYLRAHGINPNVISDAVFGNLNLGVLSQGGQFNVFDPAWYDWFLQATDNGTKKIIRVTVDQFSQIPDAIKAALSANGYFFVVDPNMVTEGFDTTAQAINESFKERYGKPILSTVKRWHDEFGNEWVSFKDKITGETITVPAPEFDEYLNALRTLQEQIRQFREEYERYKESFKDPDNPRFGHTPMEFREWLQEHLQNQGEGEGVPLFPDLSTLFPPPEEWASEGQRAAEAFTKGFDGAAKSGESLIHISEFVDMDKIRTLGRNAAKVFMEGFSNVFAGTERSVSSDGQIYADASGPFDAMFRAYAQSAAKAFTETLETNLKGVDLTSAFKLEEATSPFDATFKAYAALAAKAFADTFKTSLSGHVAAGSMVSLNVEQGESVAGPFDDTFKGYATSAATAFKETFQQQLGSWSDLFAAPTEQTGEGAASANPFEASFKAYGVQAAIAFKDTFSQSYTSMLSAGTLFVAADGEAVGNPFESTFSSYGTSAAEAFKSAFAAALANWSPLGGVTTPTVEQGYLQQDYINLGATPAQAMSITLDVSVRGLDEVTSALSTAVEKATELDALSVVVDVTDEDADAVARAVGNAIGLLNILDTKNVVADVSHNNADTVASAVQTAIDKLTTFDATTAVADVLLNGGYAVTSTLNTIINQLNSINGRVATASVLVTHTTTYSQVGTPGGGQDGDPRTAFARGGLVPFPGTYLVGEEGPELVRLPGGAWVYNNSDLRRMAANAPYSAASVSVEESRGGGMTVVFEGDIHFHNQTDIKMLVDELDRLQGRRNRAAARGMVPVDLGNLYSTT